MRGHRKLKWSGPTVHSYAVVQSKHTVVSTEL